MVNYEFNNAFKIIKMRKIAKNKIHKNEIQ